MTAVKYCSKLVAFLSCVSFFDFLCVVYIYIYIERNLWCHRVFRSSSLRWIAINDAVLATQSIGDIFFAVAGSSCVCVFFVNLVTLNGFQWNDAELLSPNHLCPFWFIVIGCYFESRRSYLGPLAAQCIVDWCTTEWLCKLEWFVKMSMIWSEIEWENAFRSMQTLRLLFVDCSVTLFTGGNRQRQELAVTGQ